MLSEAPYDTRDGIELTQTKVDAIRFGIYSFSYQGASIWNILPKHVNEGETSQYDDLV